MIKNLTNTNAQVFIQMTEEQLEAFATNIIEKCMALKTDEKESYLTIDEVVKMLDVTPTTLGRWHKSGYLKKNHVGGKVRYKQSDIERLIG